MHYTKPLECSYSKHEHLIDISWCSAFFDRAAIARFCRQTYACSISIMRGSCDHAHMRTISALLLPCGNTVFPPFFSDFRCTKTVSASLRSVCLSTTTVVRRVQVVTIPIGEEHWLHTVTMGFVLGLKCPTSTDARPMPDTSSPTRNALTLCDLVRRVLTWLVKTDSEGCQLIGSLIHIHVLWHMLYHTQLMSFDFGLMHLRLQDYLTLFKWNNTGTTWHYFRHFANSTPKIPLLSLSPFPLSPLLYSN